MIKEQETIIRLLNALIPEVKVYLFGSRARGTHRPMSDIDLALDADRKLTLQEINRARRILDALHLVEKIDVVDLQSVNQDLKSTILSEGVLWTN